MALSEIDRNLLERCLQRKPKAWEDFVDRFMGLVIHVVNHSAEAHGANPSREDRDDLCAEVFLAIIRDDFGVLRKFRGNSSLATYLAVITRRVTITALFSEKETAQLSGGSDVADPSQSVEERVTNREEVERLLDGLQGTEAEVVRMYHLEGKSYEEISLSIGMPENSIGPILSRARNKMRQAGV